jgi:hypothetical protein
MKKQEKTGDDGDAIYKDYLLYQLNNKYCHVKAINFPINENN